MTDNEIVKACKDCLHYEACKGTYSSAKGDEDILYDFDGEMYANSGCEDFEDKDLVNRQKEEIESLEKLARIADKTIETQAKEIERLKTAYFQFISDINKYKAEIENYKHLDVILNTAIDKLAKDLKAEAYKEFAERLKEKKMQSTMDRRICTFEMINNLLKELVGEENDT